MPLTVLPLLLQLRFFTLNVCYTGSKAVHRSRQFSPLDQIDGLAAIPLGSSLLFVNLRY